MALCGAFFFLSIYLTCNHLVNAQVDKHRNNALAHTISNDMYKAFKAVNNNSLAIEHILPSMYGEIEQQPNSVFIFNLTNDSNANSNAQASMLFMERKDFMDPVFPNLTFQYMAEMLKKHKKWHNVTLKEKRREGNGVGGISDNVGSDVNNDWNIFGLHGWTGELSKPVKELEIKHTDIVQSDGYPLSDILMEFTKSEIEAFSKDIEASSENKESHDNLSKKKNYKKNLTMDQDLNVYIARVNNPFGYSTKWSLNNTTQTTKYSSRKNYTALDGRTKRDVVKLYSMIKCSTGCEPLLYKGYGCYCGFSGAGVPVDGIDRCCKLHDKCYEYSNCISYLEYFVPYVWKCYRGKPLCAIDHGQFGGPQSCAARLCQCDMRLSRCLRQYTCPQRLAVCTSSFARRLQNFLLHK